MSNVINERDGFIFNHSQDVAHKILCCKICGKNFVFRITQTALAVMTTIPFPKYCSACEEKVEQILRERALSASRASFFGVIGEGNVESEELMCVSSGKSNGGFQAMNNPSNYLGGLMGGISGALGGEAAMTTMSSSVFINPYAQQQQDNALAAALQAQQFHEQYAQKIAAAALIKTSKSKEPETVKEAPKIELHPKRAVQIE